MSKITENTVTDIDRQMGRLLGSGLKLHSPLGDLHRLREKISFRGYQSFDKGDILEGLGRLQGILAELHGEMLHIDELLKKDSL